MDKITESDSIIVISDETYTDPVGTEKVPTMFVNGVATSWRTVEASLTTHERVVEYRGIQGKTAALDVGGNPAHTFGYSGNFVYTSYSRKVSRKRINDADFWRVTVTEKESTVNVN